MTTCASAFALGGIDSRRLLRDGSLQAGLAEPVGDPLLVSRIAKPTTKRINREKGIEPPHGLGGSRCSRRVAPLTMDRREYAESIDEIGI